MHGLRPGAPLRVVSARRSGGGADADEVVVLEANLDDATGELIGHAMACLREAGALDVYSTAIGMKSNRPGTQLGVIGRVEDAAKLERILFRETTTFGVRRQRCERRILAREMRTVETCFGKIRIKTGSLDGETLTYSAEFGDCEAAARQYNVPVKDVMSAALSGFASGPSKEA